MERYKIRIDFLPIYIWACLLLCTNLTAWPAENKNQTFIGNLRIFQEKYEVNGILISRLSTTGEKIRNIIIFNNIRTLDDYASWLRENIRYKKDRDKDSWSQPEETLQRKYGDCEDLAFLNEAVLKALDYRPKVLVIGRPLNNHAICVFKENNYYSLLDNTNYIKTRIETLRQFNEFLFRRYAFSSVWEIDYKTKKMCRKITEISSSPYFLTEGSVEYTEQE